MAIRINNFSQKLGEVLRRAEANLTSRQTLDNIGDKLTDDIKKRTKLGFGVENQGGSQKKFKGLAPSTKKTRKSQSQKLSSDTSPAKSNLTFTGAMVDSINHESEKGRILIKATGQDEKGIKNSDKIKYNAEKGRIIFNLTKGQIRELKDEFQKRLELVVKRLLR